MVAEQRKPFISPEQYVALERAAEYRSEYWNGEIVAMAGGTRSHNRVVRNLTRRLGNQLEGTDCEPFASETRVRVPDCNTYFYPDVQIVCGEARYEDTEAETLLNPIVIIEVLSAGTEAADRGRKFACYRTLPSLQYYILIDHRSPSIDVFTRQADGNWLLSSLSGMAATFILESMGITLPFAHIYQGIQFPPERDFLISEDTPQE